MHLESPSAAAGTAESTEQSTSVLLWAMAIWLMTVCSLGLLGRAADAMNEGIHRVCHGASKANGHMNTRNAQDGHQTATAHDEQNADADDQQSPTADGQCNSADDQAAAAATAAATEMVTAAATETAMAAAGSCDAGTGNGDAEAVIPSRRRGLFARFGEKGRGHRKAKKPRPSILAPWRRLMSRRDHTRVESDTSHVTVPISNNDDVGPTGEVHPAIAAASANMAAHQRLAQRALLASAPRSNGTQERPRKATSRRPLRGISFRGFNPGKMLFSRTRPATDEAA